MRIMILITALAVLCGCVEQKIPDVPVKQSFSYPAADADWLDTEKRLYTERRAVSPDGVDIRSACYQINADRLQFVIQLRNYDARLKDSPDNQWLVQAEVFDETAQDPELPEGQMPLRLLPFPDHDKVLLQTVTVDPDGRITDQTTLLQQLDANGGVTPLDGSESIFPASFQDSDTVRCWPVTSLQLDRGMLHSTRDMGNGAQLFSLAGAEPAADMARLVISADPVSPARSVVTYQYDLPGTELATDLDWEFPYHMSYSSESWLPPLLRLDSGLLATVLFQPDARGSSSRANYNGIFRLATLDPQDGSVRIVHEDIPPKLAILQQDGVLIYCCPTNGEEGTRWEIWATDPTGLQKRRLYFSDDSIYLNLADVAGDRLLFFRQFFAREDVEPVLFSELLEVSTEGLGRGLVRLEKKLGGSADGFDSHIPPISF